MTATVLSFLLIVVENDNETTAEIKISWGAAPRIEIMYFHREHRPNVQNASRLARTLPRRPECERARTNTTPMSRMRAGSHERRNIFGVETIMKLSFELVFQSAQNKHFEKRREAFSSQA